MSMPKEDINFNYISIPLGRYINLTLHNATYITLPLSELDHAPILLKVNVNYSFQLNVTVFQMKNTGNNDTCNYGGLAVIEESNIHYRESSACENHNGFKKLSRSFYSNGFSISLVLYWYKEYSTIHTTLRIFKTKCKVAIINPCQVFSSYKHYQSSDKLYLKHSHDLKV